MRDNIYYWKCDRPATLHGVGRDESKASGLSLVPDLRALLAGHFPSVTSIQPAGGKGNHHTYLLDYAEGRAFVRVEDGPERDGHLAMESRVMAEVAAAGVQVPRVLFTDTTRVAVPFAVQVIEYFDCTDLNHLHRDGRLPLERIAAEIGRGVARWQDVPVSGYGPFDPRATADEGRLTGYHETYAKYFHLHLDRHLRLLVQAEFLTIDEAEGIRGTVDDCAGVLDLENGCLVHKDLALWNIMGTEKEIRAFIDWDDAIAGDPVDDLSLLACFYPSPVVQAAVEGYASVRPLPVDFQQRFWLHLLRNMIVKSVIRCSSGYFNQKPGGAFLMAPGQSGPAFRAFSREKLLTAYRGLSQMESLARL
jgi:fructosamine-3-kinase